MVYSEKLTSPNPKWDTTKATAHLTHLLEHASEGFSFCRLGDRELRFLKEVSEGTYSEEKEKKRQADPDEVTINKGFGRLGLNASYHERLYKAYRDCNYLDLYLNQESNRRLIKGWDIDRAPGTITLDVPHLCNIIQAWTLQEFGSFIDGRHCIFYGAEADFLRDLVKDPVYLDIYSAFWPNPEDHVFRVPPNYGSDIEGRVDSVKESLAALARETGASVLFISLGGAAKILCHELAEECGLICLDWGSMMRGLSYCGSNGHTKQRADHHPFFARIPLKSFYEAAVRARPDALPAEKLARAQAQLCLDLQKKEVGTFSPSDVHDISAFHPSPENLRHFRQGYRYYKRNVRPLATRSRAALRAALEMEWWLIKKGIGVRGTVFHGLLRVKRIARALLARVLP